MRYDTMQSVSQHSREGMPEVMSGSYTCGGIGLVLPITRWGTVREDRTWLKSTIQQSLDMKSKATLDFGIDPLEIRHLWTADC